MKGAQTEEVMEDLNSSWSLLEQICSFVLKLHEPPPPIGGERGGGSTDRRRQKSKVSV